MKSASIQGMKLRFTRALLLLMAILLISACSTVPKEIRQAPADNPRLTEVQADPDRHIGNQVRWGGTIIAVDNEATRTGVEIVARPLHRSGRPAETDRSLGRFIADFAGFVDPAIYAEGRDITIIGVVAGTEAGTIGDHDYHWPVIRVHEHMLWPQRPELRRGYPPRYYYHHDPWYPYYYSPRRIHQRPVIIHRPGAVRPSPLSR